MLSCVGSCPGWKGLGFQAGGALGFRFWPSVEGFRVWDGRRFRAPVLALGGRVQGLGRNVLPGPGSCPGWKGLGFGTEGASGSRFLPREEGLKKQKKLTFLGMLFLGNQKKQKNTFWPKFNNLLRGISERSETR